MRHLHILIVFLLALRAGTALAAAPTIEGAPQADSGESQAFPVWEMRVLGNSRLETREIEKAVYPSLGPDRSLADIEAARDRLVQVYRDHGYATVLVDIPEQDVAEGIVRLQVTEGRLDRLRVTGARYYSRRRIVAALPEVQPGAVPELPRFQAELAALAQQSPDRRITPVLKSGQMPGTFDLELKVEDRLPLHGSVEVNDRHSADTSRTRLNASLSYDNLFQAGHSLSLQLQASPQETSEVQVWGLTYVLRQLDSRNVLALYAIDSNSDVAALGTLSVLGNGRIFGGRFVMPLESIAGFTGAVTLGADYKDFRERVRIDPDTSDTTPISYAALSAGYDASWSGERLSGSLGAGLRFGLRGVGNTDGEFAYKRYLARPNFIVATGTGALRLPLGERFALSARANAQYAPRPLISNEQFSLGGSTSVRGYLETETLVDTGATATVEFMARLFGTPGPHSFSLGSYLFADGGLGVVNNPLPRQDRSTRLGSVGGGLRADWSPWLAAQVGWAYPLLDGTRIMRGDSRLDFSFRVGF